MVHCGYFTFHFATSLIDFRRDVTRFTSSLQPHTHCSNIHVRCCEMFNKKPKRNFRQRKASSSDEEDRQKDSRDGEEDEKSTPVVNKPSKVAQSRGISCSSKREDTAAKPDSSEGEDGENLEVTGETEEKSKDKDGGNKKTNTVLSFSDEKEGNVK